jgi:DNA polymerase-3 subunit alpha/error-prone DNA polymerase
MISTLTSLEPRLIKKYGNNNLPARARVERIRKIIHELSLAVILITWDIIRYSKFMHIGESGC